MAGRDRLLALERQCLQMEKELRKCLARLDEKPEKEVALYLNPEDRLRLVNLRVWSLRYKVSLDYVVQALLGKYFAKHRRKNRSIGIRVSALTSKKAEQFLREYVRQEFPNHELEADYKEAQRRRLLRKARLHLQGIEPEDYQKQWQARHKLEQLCSQQLQRPWRGNPWR